MASNLRIAGVAFALLAAARFLPPIVGSSSAQTAAPLPLAKVDYEHALADPGDEAAFQDLLNKLPKVTLSDGPARRTYYVLEGDLLQTAQQVRAFVYAHASGAAPATTGNGELLVMTKNGAPVFWPKGQRQLTYAIDRKSFPSPGFSDLVATNFAAAAQAWVDACPTCGVSFEHKAEFDGQPSTSSVTFVIAYAPNETSFIAASFFPNDPAFRRYVLVAPSYATTTFDKVGVFRHEIGHILGYRHEQNVGVPGCVVEDQEWAPLTPYDRLSAMHYFCGGAGSLALELTGSDISGHRELYK